MVNLLQIFPSITSLSLAGILWALFGPRSKSRQNIVMALAPFGHYIFRGREFCYLSGMGELEAAFRVALTRPLGQASLRVARNLRYAIL